MGRKQPETLMTKEEILSRIKADERHGGGLKNLDLPSKIG